MAKKMKRLLALMLALALVGGQMIIPAMGSESSESPPASVPADLKVVVTPVDNGTETTTTYTDPDTGAAVTEKLRTETTTDTDTETGTTTVTTTDTSTQWENTTVTPIPGIATHNEEGFISSGSTETETVTGSEDSYHSITHDDLDRPLEEYERTEGNENTNITTTEVKEKTEDGGSQTTTTDNDFVPDESRDTDTGWITDPGRKEDDVYSDAAITQEPGDVTLEMTQKRNSDSETVYFDLEQAVGDNIQLPPAGQTETKNTDGSITRTLVEYVYGADGKTVVGYNTTITIITSGIEEDPEYTRGETDTDTDSRVGSVTSSDTTYLMPVRPEDGTAANPDGTTTVTEVKDITQDILDEEGNVIGTEIIGYEITRTTTSPDGLYSLSESESLYRTAITTTTETQTTDTTVTDSTDLTKDRVTTTTSVRFEDAEGRELIWDGVNWVYTAELGKVREGKDNGDVSITPLTPTSLVLNGKKYVLNRSDSSITPVGSHNSPEGYDYNYTGVRGEGSEYEVETSNSYDSDAHMFQLKIGNQSFYVYCVDFATTATPNYNYKIENVADATYYDAEASKHIQAIGMYGYWGVTGTNEDGTPKLGSLAALKANLTAARNAAVAAGQSFPLTQGQINNLTEGEALTATQAAFWNYGNSGKTTIDKTQQNSVITGLFTWLIHQEAPVSDTTDIIDADEFAQEASITVKDKVAETEDGTVYNTDVSFTIDVEKSSLTGNLVISLKQNGQTVDSINLATDESNWLGKLVADGTDSTKVTFTDVELIAGMKFTVSIEGTQDLEEGVYIYTSEKINNKPSQTFVGLASGTNTVGLAVDMKFTVTEPDAQLKDPGAQPAQRRTVTETEVKKDLETVTTLTTHIQEEITVENSTYRQWFREKLRQWSYEYEEDEEDIIDEDVPLADAPRTGDISMLWAAISGLSLGGVAVLSIKRREED